MTEPRTAAGPDDACAECYRQGWLTGYERGRAEARADVTALREALDGMVRRVNAVLANPRDDALLGDLDGYADAIAAQFLAATPAPAPDLDVSGVSIGPIQHSRSQCRHQPCDCWCEACDRHNAEPYRLAATPAPAPDLDVERLARAIFGVRFDHPNAPTWSDDERLDAWRAEARLIGGEYRRLAEADR